MLFEHLRVESVGTVSSTQDEVRARLAGGEDVHGLVLRAKAQLLGYGRQQRQWRSEEGGSYQTLALADESARFRSGRLPIALAVGIAEALYEAFSEFFAALSGQGTPMGLKWPNDLYLDRGEKDGVLVGKLGGILCEHTAGHLLVGVGVNVRNSVPEGAAALRDHRPDRVSDVVLEGIRLGLGLFDDEELPRLYSRYDLLRGRHLRVVEGERELKGVAAGVSSEGCLQLEGETGLLKTCNGRVIRIGTRPKVPGPSTQSATTRG